MPPPFAMFEFLLFIYLQLVLTVMLTSVVVYIYTVIAFIFFRKFYVKEEDGTVDYKCHDMATVSHRRYRQWRMQAQ